MAAPGPRRGHRPARCRDGQGRGALRPGARPHGRDRPGRRRGGGARGPPGPEHHPAAAPQRHRGRRAHQHRPGAAVGRRGRRGRGGRGIRRRRVRHRHGARARRGRGTLEALRAAVPAAGDALVVNNGAAALVLATTALAAGREVLVSRGEMVEIGDGFRLPDLIASTGARLREVGHDEPHATRRLRRRARARHRLHPQGAPEQLPRRGLHERRVRSASSRRSGLPVVVDIGSGLLRPDPMLPDEPDATRRSPTVRPSSRPAATSCSADRRPASSSATRHGRATATPSPRPCAARRQAHARGSRGDPARAGPAGHRLPPRRPRPAAAPAPSGSPLPVAGDGRPRSRGGSAAAERRACLFPAGPSRSPRPTPSRLRRGETGVVARVERGCCLVDLRCVPPTRPDVERAAGGPRRRRPSGH